MALKVNLRHLEDKNLQLSGEISAQELDLDSKDEVIRVDRPLNYDIEVQMLEDALLVQGQLSLPLTCDCVRCLKTFTHEVVLDPWSVHVPLQGDDAAPVVNDLVDLTPYVREDILLDFPQHPLCGSECGGLPETGNPGSKSREGESPETNHGGSSAWEELNKLKL